MYALICHAPTDDAMQPPRQLRFGVELIQRVEQIVFEVVGGVLRNVVGPIGARLRFEREKCDASNVPNFAVGDDDRETGAVILTAGFELAWMRIEIAVVSAMHC